MSAGVLNTNQKDAYAFMELIQPLIEDFMDSVREVGVCKQDKFVFQDERRKKGSDEV